MSDEAATLPPFREPYACVTRVGKRRWSVQIIDGIIAYGPEFGGWYRRSEARAVAKGDEELAKYLERETWHGQVIERTIADLSSLPVGDVPPVAAALGGVPEDEPATED